MTGDLLATLAVAPHGSIDGRYTATIGEEWIVALVPQGGVVTALAVRAMEAALHVDAEPLRTVSAVFAGPVAAGPVEVDVTVLRRGRSVSQATATVRNPGQEAGLTAIAAFGRTRRGFEFTDAAFPEVRPPEECPSYRDPWPEDAPFQPEGTLRNFWMQVEGRPITGHTPWETWEPTGSEVLSWHRFEHDPIGPDGRLDPSALVVLADTMPGSVGEMLGGGTGEHWFAPSVDLTVHLFGTAHPGWLLVRSTARHAGDGYASAAVELWDPTDERLVAYATQQMLFTFAPTP